MVKCCGAGKLTLEFLVYFGDVFTPINFGLLMIGTIGGLILGATPGLSPTMAVALLIPFTFRLEPAQGLILLGAAYTSTVAGGAVSAILLKIPGAPANIATTLDGHTMAKKGQGCSGIATIVSCLRGGRRVWSIVADILHACACAMGLEVQPLPPILAGDHRGDCDRLSGLIIVDQRAFGRLYWNLAVHHWV